MCLCKEVLTGLYCKYCACLLYLFALSCVSGIMLKPVL